MQALHLRPPCLVGARRNSSFATGRATPRQRPPTPSKLESPPRPKATPRQARGRPTTTSAREQLPTSPSPTTGRPPILSRPSPGPQAVSARRVLLHLGRCHPFDGERRPSPILPPGPRWSTRSTPVQTGHTPLVLRAGSPTMQSARKPDAAPSNLTASMRPEALRSLDEGEATPQR